MERYSVSCEILQDLSRAQPVERYAVVGNNDASRPKGRCIELNEVKCIELNETRRARYLRTARALARS